MANDAGRPPSRVAGVIGGLGPDATIEFLARVVALTPATVDQDHVRLLVDQNPKVPNRQDALLRGGESPVPALCDMAAGLESAGADFIVMPCNAAHAFEDDIQDAVDIPFVSIIAATVESIPGNAAVVGIMETPAASASGLYRTALQAAGIQCIELDAASGDALMRLAYAVKGGDRSGPVRDSMRKLAQQLIARGAQAIVSGCTEIPLVMGSADVAVALVSSTDALALKTIALASGALPLPAVKRR